MSYFVSPTTVMPLFCSTIPAPHSVIPAQAGIQSNEASSLATLDPRLRGDDDGLWEDHGLWDVEGIAA
jgi:hypothetical protein